MADELKALGSGTTEYSYDAPNAQLLERFDNPMPLEPQWQGVIKIEAPEFTSLCPKTGQPDFATIAIDYVPYKWCIESKSLKLYLMGYRQHGAFHEACVAQIAQDLVSVLDPLWIQVEGRFTPRGGIPFWPKLQHFKQGTAQQFLGALLGAEPFTSPAGKPTKLN